MTAGKPSLGLALGGGAARGLAHIGVLEVLEREHIEIDMIAGTSMGAIVGAAAACGRDAKTIKDFALDLSWKKLAPLIDFTVPSSGLLAGRRVKKKLKEIIGEPDFSELIKPFVCVATDVLTGEEIVIKSGSVLEAVTASMSLPIIFSVRELGGRFAVDGGLVTPVPVTPLRLLGAERIVAVNVLKNLAAQPWSIDINHPSHVKRPNLGQVIIQTVYIAASHLAETCSNQADITIEPDLAGISLADFQKAPEIVLRGELTAVDSVPKIRRMLGKEIRSRVG